MGECAVKEIIAIEIMVVIIGQYVVKEAITIAISEFYP